MNQNKKWYFTTDTNAKGFTYVHAYQTKWDPVRKTPRRSAKRYVGRLFEDGRVIPSKAFLESFPQYAGYSLYYGADKQLVDEETYRRDFPLPPGPQPEPEDAPVKDDVLNTAPGLRGLYPRPERRGFTPLLVKKRVLFFAGQTSVQFKRLRGVSVKPDGAEGGKGIKRIEG